MERCNDQPQAWPPKVGPPVRPHLTVKDGMRAIEFYKNAFGAEEVSIIVDPNTSKIAHSELLFGTSIVYVADELGYTGLHAPPRSGDNGVTLHLCTHNLDRLWQAAVSSGAIVLVPLEDRWWGERCGRLIDPFGHRWCLVSAQETPSAEEISHRFREWLSSRGLAGSGVENHGKR